MRVLHVSDRLDTRGGAQRYLLDVLAAQCAAGEALSAGTPVVAWDSGGIAEWHPGPLAPWGDVDALAALLRAAVATPAPAPRPGFRRADGLRALTAAYARVRRAEGPAGHALR